MIRLVLALALVAVFAPDAEARVDIDCRAAYQRGQLLWSPDYRVRCTFMTGRELNVARRSFNYHHFSSYVLIWFNDQEYATVQLDPLSIGVTGPTVDVQDLAHVLLPPEGIDARGRRWRVKLNNPY